MEDFWTVPKKLKKRISRIKANNKKSPMFEGTFKVLRGIQGVWFFANLCRIIYRRNAYLSTTFGNSNGRSRNSGSVVELGLIESTSRYC